MKKVLFVLAVLAIAAPAFAAPGLDLSANGVCAGLAGSGPDGGSPDCATLAANSKKITVIGTFVPAEAITDLSGSDGECTIAVIGDLTGNAAWWNGTAGGCLDGNGGAVKFSGIKPAACPASVREAFPDGGSNVPVVDPGNSVVHYFYNNFKSGTVSVTTASRILGFEMQADPAYTTEAGFGLDCGVCNIPVCVTWDYVIPGSFSGSVTTKLQSPTGAIAGVTNHAFFNGGCAAVPTRAKTWGQLKSLYR